MLVNPLTPVDYGFVAEKFYPIEMAATAPADKLPQTYLWNKQKGKSWASRPCKSGPALSLYELNYVLEREGKRIYLRKAEDFHRPKALIWASDIPRSAAKEAAPMRKL